MSTVDRGVRTLLAVLLVGALAGCSILNDDWVGPPGCAPVDEGGECFDPSRDGFLDHAIESARGWPQLDGIALDADTVLEAFDEEVGAPTWIVPIEANGAIVAASRFLPAGNQVKLAEVALYLPPRRSIPVPAPAQRLVLFLNECVEPGPGECLFQNYGWRLEPD